MTGEDMNECVRCGDEYERYNVFVRDNFVDIVGQARTQQRWDLEDDGNDGLCKPCRMAVTKYGAYLTEEERENLEPKYEV